MNCPKCEQEGLKDCACTVKPSQGARALHRAGRKTGHQKDLVELINPANSMGYRLAMGFRILRKED